MSRVMEELIYLILHYLYENGFMESAQMLGCETGLHFDMKYFEDMVLAGEFDDADRYLHWFTSIGYEKKSTEIFFELRKHKFLEALVKNNRAMALDILIKDLKVFSPKYEEQFKEMTQLLATNNIRQHKSLSAYEDVVSVRKLVLQEIKLSIHANSMFDGRLKLPANRYPGLLHLGNESFKCQHLIREDAAEVSGIRTLLEDHVCKPCLDSSPLQSEGNISSEESDANSGDNASDVTRAATFSTGVINPETTLVNPKDADVTGSSCDASNEVTSAIDLPTNLFQTLKEDSTPTSMDFHPTKHNLLLVGTDDGTISLWDVGLGKKLFSKKFGVSDVGALCTDGSKDEVAPTNELKVSVKKIAWCPDGSLFGVAFSENIVQLYGYYDGDQINQHFEIVAHAGSVNDLAFSNYGQQLLMITCGDDHKIKVWSAICGIERLTFEGHKAPVCSIIPQTKQNFPFIFSTSTDGEIKAWLSDGSRARADVAGPCYGHSSLAYRADGQRLFSCGNDKDGEPYLIEWNDDEGFMKRIYKGLKKPCFSTVHFDTTMDHILAVGDDHFVKFWDMDSVEIVTKTDGNGELVEHPCISFNKVGTLLAVSATENRIKIFAKKDGISLDSGGGRTPVKFQPLKALQKLGLNKIGFSTILP